MHVSTRRACGAFFASRAIYFTVLDNQRFMDVELVVHI